MSGDSASDHPNCADATGPPGSSSGGSGAHVVAPAPVRSHVITRPACAMLALPAPKASGTLATTTPPSTDVTSARCPNVKVRTASGSATSSDAGAGTHGAIRDGRVKGNTRSTTRLEFEYGEVRAETVRARVVPR